MYRALYRGSLLIGMLWSHQIIAAPLPEPPASPAIGGVTILTDSLSAPGDRTAPVISVQLCYGESFRGRPFYADTLLTEVTTTSSGAEERQMFDIRVAFTGDDSYIDGPFTLCGAEEVELSVSRDFPGFNWEDGSSGRSRKVTGPGSYRVTVTDAGGCTKTLSHLIAESAVSVTAADAVRPRCPGGKSGSISVVARGEGPLLYALDGKDGFQQTGHFDSLAAGNYTVRVENPDGCTAQRSVTVPDASPLRLFAPHHRSGTAHPGQALRLPTAPNFTPREVRWRVEAQLDCTDCLAPAVAAADEKTFVAEAQSLSGCLVRDTFALAVSPEEVVFRPGAFTPDGDGQNDRWWLHPSEELAAVGDLSISNEEGEICHRQNRPLPPDDNRLQWDGTHHGRSAETGTYRYAATLHLKDGTQSRITGSLQLVR